eukprot:5174177-Pleurochrysis_carterae.AAC.1
MPESTLVPSARGPAKYQVPSTLSLQTDCAPLQLAPGSAMRDAWKVLTESKNSKWQKYNAANNYALQRQWNGTT